MLCSSGAKCCTCDDTAAVNHVINLGLSLYTIQVKLQCVNGTVVNQINLTIAALVSDVLLSSSNDTLDSPPAFKNQARFVTS